ncbi:uncharacterized protein LOC121711329 [Alosa sapidissima]|uniref:uncharacterized protein LOC121711329 n=1 Tax=Alosa sapidissima TaxID=34773 RepID=UPI001C08449F|nr:uncharacterized protein LOC121711329 [Alosa sapidissima]
MASIPCALLLLLICPSQVHMGVQGGNSPTVFSSAGGTATLPCANVLDPNCSSTTWLYSSTGPTDELFGHGKIKPENGKNRAERLSLFQNCSLHITDVTTEDAGLYICQQYEVGGRQSKYGAPVYLTVLHVFASSRETEMEAGSHVTLHCILHTHDNCTGSVRGKGVCLSWVDKTESKLSNITHRQIRATSTCSITLMIELRVNNSTSTPRKWRCQLAAEWKVQTTAIYTIRIKETVTRPTASTNSGVLLITRAGVFVSLLAAALIIIVLIHKRKC